MTETKEEMSFEQSMDRLDKIVAALERGEVGLEASLALFEEGSALIAKCGAMLNEAEQKVVTLAKGPDGAPVESLFDAPED